MQIVDFQKIEVSYALKPKTRHYRWSSALRSSPTSPKSYYFRCSGMRPRIEYQLILYKMPERIAANRLVTSTTRMLHKSASKRSSKWSSRTNWLWWRSRSLAHSSVSSLCPATWATIDCIWTLAFYFFCEWHSSVTYEWRLHCNLAVAPRLYQSLGLSAAGSPNANDLAHYRMLYNCSIVNFQSQPCLKRGSLIQSSFLFARWSKEVFFLIGHIHS